MSTAICRLFFRRYTAFPAETPDGLRRLAQRAEERTPHPIAVEKADFMGNDIHRMTALLEHQSRGSYALVRQGGVVVSAVQKPDRAKLPQGVSSDFLLVNVDTGILEKLGRLAADGQLKTRLGEVLSPACSINRVQARSRSGRAGMSLARVRASIVCLY
ncbi:hypothetical protein LMG29542_00865 [Paraburkholderia humisilvae]|uniref:Uncharacterized protein n=1 Tax=Paraburkholderia humisilvae TaxID=627669 RepID=A0A6J5D8L8_9BURK|nr:hypothetical protein LMG29542_00865 [Paraburkholderia humisilvae]